MDSDEIMSIATDIRGTAGVILMDRAPVNAINHDIRRGILDALEELAGNTSLLSPHSWANNHEAFCR